MLMIVSPDDGYGFFKWARGNERQLCRESSNPLTDLQKRNIVNFEPLNKPDPKCPFELNAHLTDNGRLARSFIFNLITAQLKSASPTQQSKPSN